MKCEICGKIATTLWDDRPRCWDHPCECGHCSPTMIHTKPPLGIKPEWLHNEHRMREIMEAVMRYWDESKTPPEEWFCELHDLSEKMFNHTVTKGMEL